MTSSAKPSEIVTGGVVVTLALGFGLYASGIVGGAVTGIAYSASFESAQGVSAGTDVRLAGVKVGQITGIALNPDTYRAETDFTVSAKLDLPEDTRVAVASEGLLGGTYVELLPGASPFKLAPGTEIRDTRSSVGVVDMLMRAFEGGGR